MSLVLSSEVTQELLLKMEGLNAKQIGELYKNDELRIYSNTTEFLRWYYEDNEDSAVELLIELVGDEKHKSYDRFEDYIMASTQAIKLDDGRVVFCFE